MDSDQSAEGRNLRLAGSLPSRADVAQLVERWLPKPPTAPATTHALRRAPGKPCLPMPRRLEQIQHRGTDGRDTRRCPPGSTPRTLAVPLRRTSPETSAASIPLSLFVSMKKGLV